MFKLFIILKFKSLRYKNKIKKNNYLIQSLYFFYLVIIKYI